MLVTGNNNGILLGNLGDDTCLGGNQKDILLGGRGADRLEAGNADDILIAGYSPTYEDNTPAARAALCSILDEWEHGSGGYAGRVSHITNGGGRNGTNVFDGTTIFDDGDVDVLLGGSGRDWFLMNATGGVAIDLAPDRTSGEIVTDSLVVVPITQPAAESA
jgi:Ca2+-binding RTX toxin-like protein